MAVAFSLTSCYARIDAGHEGIKVNLYGDSKGVDDVELVTGAVWYNPIKTAVYEYPTFVQTVDYKPFDINAKDGSKFTVDPTININLIPGTAAATFKKYRKPMNEVIHDVLKTHIYGRTLQGYYQWDRHLFNSQRRRSKIHLTHSESRIYYCIRKRNR